MVKITPIFYASEQSLDEFLTQGSCQDNTARFVPLQEAGQEATEGEPETTSSSDSENSEL